MISIQCYPLTNNQYTSPCRDDLLVVKYGNIDIIPFGRLDNSIFLLIEPYTVNFLFSNQNRLMDYA